MTTSRTITLIATAALAIAACGGDDDDDAADEAFVTAMVDQGATEDQAECLAGELSSELRELFLSGADAPSSPEDGQAILDAYESCEIDLASLGDGGSDDEAEG